MIGLVLAVVGVSASWWSLKTLPGKRDIIGLVIFIGGAMVAAYGITSLPLP